MSNIGVKYCDPGTRIRVLGSSGMICGYSSIRILVTALLFLDILCCECRVCGYTEQGWYNPVQKAMPKSTSIGWRCEHQQKRQPFPETYLVK